MIERKTLAQFATEAACDQIASIAGKPANKCPYCGAGMFVDGVNRTDYEIVRYVKCRNETCRRRFVSRQAPAKLAREIH